MNAAQGSGRTAVRPNTTMWTAARQRRFGRHGQDAKVLPYEPTFPLCPTRPSLTVRPSVAQVPKPAVGGAAAQV